MSLTDLKKSKDASNKRRTFTVDEFISDAENYARGAPEIVSSELNNQLNLTQAIAVAQKHVADKKANKEKHLKQGSKKAFRHATFTLSEDAINQLSELAIETKLAKSHILRILIDELCNKDQQEKLHKLLGSKID